MTRWTSTARRASIGAMTEPDPERDTLVDLTFQLASLPRRLSAVAVDGALAFASGLALSLPFGAPPVGDPLEPDAWARWVEAGACLPFVVGAAAVAAVLQGALPRSPGKLLTGLELARTDDGLVPGAGQRWARAALALATNAVGLFGTAWIIADPSQRALYDRLSRQVVVRTGTPRPSSE